MAIYLAIYFGNKSFIDQACSVKMAGYWPRSFFTFYAYVLTHLWIDSTTSHQLVLQ